AENPMLGLLIGILTTSLVQSSSTTTSIVVGLVGGGLFSIEQAIPIVMGANVGTSITNTVVSLGHIRNKDEFRKAFGAATVHDIFNFLTVAVLMPLQMQFNLLGRIAYTIEQLFEKGGGFTFTGPIKLVVDPVVGLLEWAMMENGWVMLIGALVILLVSLRSIVTIMKTLMIEKLQEVFNKVIFRSPAVSMLAGVVLTAIVQSSSVTTSLIVPLAATGVVTLKQVLPFTMGANIGTTFTALLAALVTAEVSAITVALTHLMFNILGIGIFLPFMKVPAFLADRLAFVSAEQRWFPFVLVPLVFIGIPLVVLIFSGGGLQ
ncbi:hypothetical protein GF324_07110, partial [bacterium]|nr:hypothetical protein [bacterium]